MDIYLHGIQTIEKNDGPRPVATIDTGIIGLVFTAPAADAATWPLNTPVAVFGEAGFPGLLGTEGTGLDAFQAIFLQATRASQTVVAVRVEEGDTPAETIANVLGSPTAYTGVHALRQAKEMLNLKPKILIAPGFTSGRPTDGVKTISITNQGTGYTSAPEVTITGGGGAGATAAAIVSAGAVTELQITNPGSGYTSVPTVSFSGGGGAGAAATVTLGAVASPVTTELLSIANRLRAVVIADGPNTTSQAAVDYRLDYDTDRLLIVDPFVKRADGGAIINMPASAFVAGLQARVDYEEGFWFSASNHVIEGIVGTARTIEHSISDPSAESQFLNKNAVAVVVRAPSGGFKLWGSRVPSSDSLRQFLSVRRAHDTIIESIELAHEPFIDKPFSVQSLSDIAESVNSALRRWQVMGATLGGRVWFDPGLNTKETWVSGKLFVSYDAEAPAPIEQITFVFNRNTGYYEDLADAAIAEVSRLAGTAVQ